MRLITSKPLMMGRYSRDEAAACDKRKLWNVRGSVAFQSENKYAIGLQFL